MTAAIAAEIDRINVFLYRITRKSELVQEVPLKIHAGGVDEGHGLGGPRFSEAFVSFIGQVCACGRRKDPYNKDDHGCSAAPTRTLYESDKRQHPQRLKRALRKLRAIAPAEYDALYLMVALGMDWYAARDRINEGRLRRGQPEYTESEFLVLSIAGAAKMTDVY